MSTAPGLKIAHVAEEAAEEVVDKVIIEGVVLLGAMIETVPVAAVLFKTADVRAVEAFADELLLHCGKHCWHERLPGEIRLKSTGAH